MDETTGRGTLSAKDISYWASEQTKDLSRISKHLQLLLQQVNPLKSQLEASHKQKDELHKQLEDLSRVLQAEKEAQARQTKEAEQKLAVKNKEHSEAVARLEQDRDDLRRGTVLCPACPPRPAGGCRKSTEALLTARPQDHEQGSRPGFWWAPGPFPVGGRSPGSGSWLSTSSCCR